MGDEKGRIRVRAAEQRRLEREERERRDQYRSGGGEEEDDVPALLVKASSVRAKRLRWAWEGRIPLGTVGLMIGYEGLGKSVLTTEITARLTRGELPGDLTARPSMSSS